MKKKKFAALWKEWLEWFGDHDCKFRNITVPFGGWKYTHHSHSHDFLSKQDFQVPFVQRLGCLELIYYIGYMSFKNLTDVLLPNLCPKTLLAAATKQIPQIPGQKIKQINPPPSPPRQKLGYTAFLPLRIHQELQWWLLQLELRVGRETQFFL